MACLQSQTGSPAPTSDAVPSQYDPLSLVASALSGLAASLIQAGEAQNAQRALLSALDVDSENASALCTLGTLYHAVGEHQKALPLLERGVLVLEESSRWFEQFAAVVSAIGDRDLATRFEHEIHRPQDTDDILNAAREVLAECRKVLEAV